MLLCNDVDHSGNGVTAVERRTCTLHDFDTVNVLRIYQSQVVFTTVVAVNALSVNEYQDVAVAQSVHLNVATHVVLAKIDAARKATQNVFNALSGILPQHLSADHFGLYRSVFQRILRSRAGHYHGFQQTLTSQAVGRRGLGPNSCACHQGRCGPCQNYSQLHHGSSSCIAEP